ncbi:hypothetical protein ACTXQV_67730, partial [Klebsiella pneumoniae]
SKLCQECYIAATSEAAAAVSEAAASTATAASEAASEAAATASDAAAAAGASSFLEQPTKAKVAATAYQRRVFR